jgi:small conductance mechanosensitive channel
MEQVEALLVPLTDLAVDVGTRIVGAIVLWIVGKVLIGLVKRAAAAALSRRGVDPTLARYVDSSLGVLLTVVLVIGVLGVFGVETTTFAGLLAAAGVAIGMAWSGMLSNFAAGVFMIVLRPFKVGDMIEAAGVLGTVHEIGLFVTTVDTPDNVRTYLGNNSVFSSTIRNYNANPFRRVDLVAQLAHGTDHVEAAKLLRAALAKIPNVATTPPPDVEILEFNLAGPVLAVRPYCHNDHYWQVYFDTNRTIRESFGAKGYAVPSTHVDMTTHA